jgi:hypothetical protein
VSDSPWVGAVDDITELASFYAEPPAGVRVNMIFSADGAAAFGGRAGPLSCPTDQQLPAGGPPTATVPFARPVALRLEHALVYDDYLLLKYRR